MRWYFETLEYRLFGDKAATCLTMDLMKPNTLTLSKAPDLVSVNGVKMASWRS
jgi:hypothetical protein